MPNAPILIGVTGGIGAGKSTVVEAFARRGAVPFSADTAVHELYARPAVVAAVRERWGDDMVAADGTIDRSAIASIVFVDPEQRRWLEGLLHPLVGEAWLSFVAAQNALAHPPEFAVAEVPLLFEAGLEDRYDAIVTITAPLPTRIERAEARGSGRTLSAERAAAQMPEAEKAERADYSYVNTGSVDDLDAFAGRVLDELRAARVP
ncbi:MAG: dephospho-CoA kinase [Thermoleophilia bacterium]|nr:dephospho-CoA kinase [Thermoleophilia bacterium]